MAGRSAPARCSGQHVMLQAEKQSVAPASCISLLGKEIRGVGRSLTSCGNVFAVQHVISAVPKRTTSRKPMKTIWHRFRKSDGQGLVEYVLILMVMVILCVVVLTRIGEKTVDPLANMANALP